MGIAAKIRRAEHSARKSTRGARPWLVVFARGGYIAKGLTYTLIGGIAARATFGADETEGSVGALAELLGSSLGTLLVGSIAVGLCAFGVWRLVRGITNPEDDGAGTRLASLGSAVINFGLGIAAARLVLNGGNHDEENEKRWTAIVLDAPAGKWILIGIAACIIAAGVWRVYRAWADKLDDELDLGRLGVRMRRWLVRIARVGMAARGVVFLLIGLVLGAAAWQRDPSKARDFGDTLAGMLAQPYGRWLLSVTAVGLMAYGVYQFILARYRRVLVG